MVLYRAADEPLVRLEESCSYGCDIFIISVKARDEFILYGDVLRSMTVLQYKPAGSTLHSGKVAAKDTLERVAKDYNINSLRAVEFFRDKDHYIGAEDFGNLFVGSRPPSSVPLEDIIKLHIESEFHLGDSVNCLRPGRLNVQPRDGGGAAEECDDLQSILFGTVSGGIGSIMAITEETFQFFSALEQAMRIVIQGLGGFSHQEFRTFHNGRRGNGATAGASSLTVDGDLIEQFVDLPKEEMLLVVRQLNDLFHLRRSAAGGGSKKMTQSAMSSEAVLTGTLWTKENYAAEDVIQAVEEMIRSH